MPSSPTAPWPTSTHTCTLDQVSNESAIKLTFGQGPICPRAALCRAPAAVVMATVHQQLPPGNSSGDEPRDSSVSWLRRIGCTPLLGQLWLGASTSCGRSRELSRRLSRTAPIGLITPELWQGSLGHRSQSMLHRRHLGWAGRESGRAGGVAAGRMARHPLCLGRLAEHVNFRASTR